MKMLAQSCLIALLILPTVAFAFEKPPEPCGGMDCTPRLLEIAHGFSKAGGITQADLPLLASGECYHMNNSYSPHTTHYGVVFLDPHEGEVFMGGSFGFFFPENPYRNWTFESARKDSPNLYARNHLVELTDSFAFSDMNPGATPIWWYWVRKSGEKAYVMGHWGVFHRFLCELDVHGHVLR